VKVAGSHGPPPGDGDATGVALIDADTEGDGDAESDATEGDGDADGAFDRDGTSEPDGKVDADGAPDFVAIDGDGAAVIESDPPPATQRSVTLPFAPIARAAPPAAPAAYDTAAAVDRAHELPPPPGPSRAMVE
jgi:hypothetical protein